MTPLLSIKQLTYNPTKRWEMFTPASNFVLGPVDLHVHQSETLAIIGSNDSGKSLLAKLIVGAVKPTSGEILLNGQPIGTQQSKARANNIRMVFRHSAESLNPGIAIGSMLDEPLRLNTQLSSTMRYEKVMQTLSLVGLMPDHYYFYKHMLSDGQQQRVALARALILDPQVIVADEPFAALDPSVRSQTVNLLLKLQAELGLAFIFISHNLGIVRHMADRTVVMSGGQIVESNLTQTLFAAPEHPSAQKLIHAHNSMLKL